MGTELFQNASASEILLMALLVFAMGFALLIPFAWIFGRTLALRERPERRALWTAGAAYVCSVIAWIFMGGDAPLWAAPIIPLPGAAAVYFWLLAGYRKDWVDDDKVTEGMRLENSDWRLGVVAIVSIVAAAVVKVSLIT